MMRRQSCRKSHEKAVKKPPFDTLKRVSLFFFLELSFFEFYNLGKTSNKCSPSFYSLDAPPPSRSNTTYSTRNTAALCDVAPSRRRLCCQAHSRPTHDFSNLPPLLVPSPTPPLISFIPSPFNQPPIATFLLTTALALPHFPLLHDFPPFPFQFLFLYSYGPPSHNRLQSCSLRAHSSLLLTTSHCLIHHKSVSLK